MKAPRPIFVRRSVQAFGVVVGLGAFYGMIMFSAIIFSERDPSAVWSDLIFGFPVYPLGIATVVAGWFAVRSYSRRSVKVLALVAAIIFVTMVLFEIQRAISSMLPEGFQGIWEKVEFHSTWLFGGIVYIAISSLVIRTSFGEGDRWPKGSVSPTKRGVQSYCALVSFSFMASIGKPLREWAGYEDPKWGGWGLSVFIALIAAGFIHYYLLNWLLLKIIQWINPMTEEDEAGEEKSNEGAPATVPQTG